MDPARLHPARVLVGRQLHEPFATGLDRLFKRRRLEGHALDGDGGDHGGLRFRLYRGDWFVCFSSRCCYRFSRLRGFLLLSCFFSLFPFLSALRYFRFLPFVRFFVPYIPLLYSILFFPSLFPSSSF